uniref:Uncharacterized protein n=1 Tax=Setaria italica TaxID=4555 RepID=K3XNN6_SETIT
MGIQLFMAGSDLDASTLMEVRTAVIIRARAPRHRNSVSHKRLRRQLRSAFRLSQNFVAWIKRKGGLQGKKVCDVGNGAVSAIAFALLASNGGS